MPPFLLLYWKQIAMAVAVVLVIMGAWYNGYNYRDGICIAENARAVAEWQAKIDEERKFKEGVSAQLEDALALMRKQDEIIKSKVKNEVKSNPVYTTCVVPDSGVQLHNSTVRQYNEARHPK